MKAVSEKAESSRRFAATPAAGAGYGARVTAGPDQRPAAAGQRKLQASIAESPRGQQAATWQQALDGSPRQQAAPAPVQRQANKTGLPDHLKAGVENLSGHSLDDVRVQYNSARPAQLQAHAYAQGTDIHLAPGQEKHLPHEAWHVAQQKQGRVRPTMQLKGNVPVNDNTGLEKEADVMGAKAAGPAGRSPAEAARRDERARLSNRPVLTQLKVYQFGKTEYDKKPRKFTAGGIRFRRPRQASYRFSSTSAEQAVQPIPHGAAKTETGRNARTGVQAGDVGSYAYVQHLEKTGDKLTGDHQPSGAAIKDSLRENLHVSMKRPLTRSMARNAYKKAVTVVMPEDWHRKVSRTYGGRNSRTQIGEDSRNLARASVRDWKKTVLRLQQEGKTDDEIKQIWSVMHSSRKSFFEGGNAQVGNL